MRHCIVTPELAPLIRNGGVGTNALNLSKFLAEEAGEDVTILLARPIEGADSMDLEEWERRSGARIFLLQRIACRWDVSPVYPRDLGYSLQASWWLRDQSFDIIHFMQYQAAGFASVRAKRLGAAFQHTQLVTILNSPERWLAEHGRRPPDGTGRGLVLDYMERYSVEHSDHVTCPSKALLDWLKHDGWRLPKTAQWLPTYSPPVKSFKHHLPDPLHIVFFGRLETRKGLVLFASALSLLASKVSISSLPLRITFLGKVAAVENMSSESYLKRTLAGLPPAWSWEILGTLDQPACMAYLEAHSGALYVMPSEADNSPNTVLECLARGLRMLCSDTPGVSELFANRAPLVAPFPDAWSARLANAILQGEKPAVAALPSEKVVGMRLAFLERLRQAAAPVQRTARRSDSHRGLGEKISVVVPHHNAGHWLIEAVQSLTRQTDGNFEVTVVDDGSTCPRSLSIFRAMERGCADSRFRFLRKRNGGVCSARNHGASQGSGTLLIFMDADNIALPDMIATMRRRLEHSALDALSCDLHGFDHQSRDPLHELRMHWAFAGGPLEGALKTNCLGDSHMIVRRNAFDAIGGFRPASDEASADRAFLVRLLIAGFKLDSTDECLFAYRLNPNGMSRTSDQYERGRAVISAFTEGLEPWLARLLESNFPIYGASPQTAQDGDGTRLLDRQAALWAKVREEREKRRERDRRVDHLFGIIAEMRRHPLVRLARFLRGIPRNY